MDNLGYQIQTEENEFLRLNFSRISLTLLKASVIGFYYLKDLFIRPGSKIACIWRNHFLIGLEALRTQLGDGSDN